MKGYIKSFWNIRKIYVMKIERKKNYITKKVMSLKLREKKLCH